MNKGPVFLPITGPSPGPDRIRCIRRLARLAGTFDKDSITLRCECGETIDARPRRFVSGSEDVARAFWAWVDLHGTHMPMLQNEPPERGVLFEEGKELRPALRFPDGRIEAD